MKRLFSLFVALLVLFSVNVYADGITMDIKIKDSKHYLIVYKNDNEAIEYLDAVKEFGLEEYLEMYHGKQYLYFYRGKEITKKEYIRGHASELADKRCSKFHEYGRRVKTTDEVIRTIDEIINNNRVGEYHLVYSEIEYKDIEFKKVMKYFEDRYIVPFEKNLYKYQEYGLKQPIKHYPVYSNEEMIVDMNGIKTDKEEEKKVDEFLKYLLPYFDGVSDYEKVLGVYTYLNNTTKYETDHGFTIFQDGLLSPYDALIKKKIVCIGAATTFQFLMEKLGVNSYIVDHLYDNSNGQYNTDHTYNVVELDGYWYIVDINNKDDLSGFLIGNKNKKYDKKDFKYYDLVIEDVAYLEKNPNANKEFEFDYENLSKKLDYIIKGTKETTTKKQEEKKEIKNDDTTAYIVLGLILIIIFLVIVLFTKRK